jgi:hypothetical protein
MNLAFEQPPPEGPGAFTTTNPATESEDAEHGLYVIYFCA